MTTFHHTGFVGLLRASILALCLLSGWGVAEAGGPTYSRYGVGDRFFFGSGRAHGMGLAGIALTGSGFINRWNPATLAGTQSILFSGSLGIDRLMVTDPYGTSNYNRGEFQSLALAIPIAPAQGFTLAFDLTPYSKVRYGVKRIDTESAYPSTQTLSGTGSVAALSASGSFALDKDFLIGLRFTHLFGRIEQVLSVAFDDPSFVDSETQENRHHNGNMVSASLAFSGFKSMLGIDALEHFTFGLIVSSPSRLNVRADQEYFSSILADTTVNVTGTTEVPFSIGAGISYLLNNRYVISGEVIAEQWSKASFFDAPPIEMRNSIRAALGIESLASRDASGFWNRISYSVGATYHATALVVNGKGLDEAFGSAGIGFPLGANARMRLAFQGGVRTTGDATLARESFLRLSLTLSVGEDWVSRIDED